MLKPKKQLKLLIKITLSHGNEENCVNTFNEDLFLPQIPYIFPYSDKNLPLDVFEDFFHLRQKECHSKHSPRSVSLTNEYPYKESTAI